MKGIIEGLLYVQGDLGLTIKQVSDILSISEEEAKRTDIFPKTRLYKRR